MDFEHPFSPLRISASALAAERTRMNVIASNLANANTPGAPGQEPYRKSVALFQTVLDQEAQRDRAPGAGGLGGVRVESIVKSTAPFRKEHRPGHAYADENGDVLMPNFNSITEMVDLMTASRSYQANLAVLQSFKDMLNRTLQIGR